MPWNTRHLLDGVRVCPAWKAQSSTHRAGGDTLTQARGLLPLDLRELGDGVGPVAVSEDDAQLLADHLVLRGTESSSACGGLSAASRGLLPGTRPPRQRRPRTHLGSQENPPDIALPVSPAGPGVACSPVYCVSSGLTGESLICN